MFVGLLSMSTQIGVGLSLLADSCQAASGAVNSALAGVQNSKDSLVLVFSTQAYEHEVVLQVINDNIETCSIVGFTVAGVFTGRKVATEGIIVAVIGSEELEFYCGYEAGLSLDQDVAGSKVGQFFSNILSQTGRHSLQLLFPDGLNNRVGSLLDLLFHTLGSRTKYAGGVSGNGFYFRDTRQYFGSRILKDALVGALIISDSPIGVSVAHGWKPVSPPMIVTRAEGNVIYELDWEPAYDVYARFARRVDNVDVTEDLSHYLMGHPFGIPQAKEEYGYIVRDPVAKNDDGSLLCVGEIPINSVLRVLSGNKESLLSAVKTATRAAVDQIGTADVAGVLVFSCVSRMAFLQDQFADEALAVQAIVGDAVPVCGCMTFGEIGTIDEAPLNSITKLLWSACFPGGQKENTMTLSHEAELDRKLRDLSVMYELTSSIGTSLDLQRELDHFLQKLLKRFGFSLGSILFKSEEDGLFYVASSRGHLCSKKLSDTNAGLISTAWRPFSGQKTVVTQPDER